MERGAKRVRASESGSAEIRYTDKQQISIVCNLAKLLSHPASLSHPPFNLSPFLFSPFPRPFCCSNSHTGFISWQQSQEQKFLLVYTSSSCVCVCVGVYICCIVDSQLVNVCALCVFLSCFHLLILSLIFPFVGSFICKCCVYVTCSAMCASYVSMCVCVYLCVCFTACVCVH